MTEPKLGFKLWKRKIFKDIKVLSKSTLNWLNTFLGLILAILGIYLAYTANNLASQGNLYSKSSFELAKNDTSQQAQINKLAELLYNQKMQLDTLVEIVSQLKRLNENSTEEISQVYRQTNLLSDNSKPLLKDVDYSFKPLEKGDFTKKINFTFISKNFGQRPAYNLNPTVFFVKLSNGKIQSHGSLKPADYEKYQSILYPGESKTYSVVSKFSQNGISDLKDLVTVFRYVYFDKAISKQDTSIFFYEHSLNEDDSYSIKIARPEVKKEIVQYLKLKTL